ncbi:hypothetical protein A2331_06810 [Candidatus Falkowbacteria bacterium RIFOXYB2_FULL_34_18]|nr:MAG: hypothetical protein A2331_06810 [Candidatus Falkowbacteria bacterium RIFOXYB2_FULL_34_18]OGF37174.1 MAG: hypothetical protein A2466_02650 [Candidatus Falkowbacteria bacterium RIFOXYC2_FULL_34_220]OGF39505.1 MAG: hypothetical protein A2515_04235 [Candidatus Falkowbacteria bacterium RIFOXYD12_FULL_34_57]
MINKKRLKAIYWNKFSLAGFMALPCLFFVIIFTSPSPWSSVLTAFLFFIIILTLPLTHFGEDTYQTYLVCKEKFKKQGLFEKRYPCYCNRVGYKMALAEYKKAHKS